MITAAVIDARLLKANGLESSVYASLSAGRRSKADRYRFERGRLLSLCAGAALDFCLASAGLRERDAQIACGSHGKPYIAGHTGLFFNLSHSGSLAVCALAGQEIGVDIERQRENVSEALMRRVCTAHEAELLFSLDTGSRSAEFCRLWTVKESYMKLLGTGLATPPESLDVSFEPNGITLLDKGAPARAAFWQREIADCRLTICTARQDDVSLTVPTKDALEKFYG